MRGIPALSDAMSAIKYGWQGEDVYYASTTLRLVSLDGGTFAPLSAAPSYTACLNAVPYTSFVSPEQHTSFCFRSKDNGIIVGISIVPPLPDFGSSSQSAYTLTLRIAVWPAPMP